MAVGTPEMKSGKRRRWIGLMHVDARLIDLSIVFPPRTGFVTFCAKTATDFFRCRVQVENGAV
jgi:hypothetical protein